MVYLGSGCSAILLVGAVRMTVDRPPVGAVRMRLLTAAES
jgi:hypothetical protein